jgi:GTPase SAR1 family protein
MYTFQIQKSSVYVMDIQINDFTLNFIPTKSILIHGKPRSGKSTLIKSIIYELSSVFDLGTVFTNKDHEKNFYDFVDIQNIYTIYSSLLSKRFIQNSCVIFDDFNTNYTHVIKHPEMSLIVSSNDLIKEIQFDYIFILHRLTEEDLCDVFYKYIEKFMDFDTFLYVINNLDTEEIPVINVFAEELQDLIMVYSNSKSSESDP